MAMFIYYVPLRGNRGLGEAPLTLSWHISSWEIPPINEFFVGDPETDKIKDDLLGE